MVAFNFWFVPMLFSIGPKKQKDIVACKQFCTCSVFIVHCFKWRQRGQYSGDLASSCLVWPASLKAAFSPCNLFSLDMSLKIHISVCVYIWLCLVICVDWYCHHESSVIATKINVLHIQRANHIFPWVKKNRERFCRWCYYLWIPVFLFNRECGFFHCRQQHTRGRQLPNINLAIKIRYS